MIAPLNLTSRLWGILLSSVLYSLIIVAIIVIGLSLAIVGSLI